MTDIYDNIVAGIEQMQLGIPAEAYGVKPRSVYQILNNPSRLAYEFKMTELRINRTLQIIKDVIRGDV